MDFRRVVSNFGGALLFFSSIAGLIAASKEEGLSQIVLVVLSLSLLYAVGRQGWAWAIDAINAVRNYPRLLQQVVDLREQVSRLTHQVAGERAKGEEAYHQGVREGHMQFWGSLLSTPVKKMPELIAIAEENDRVRLIARNRADAAIRPGARFEVRVQGTGSRTGVVAALPGETENIDVVHFECVEETTPAFWKGLQNRVGSDPSPPAGVELTRYELDTSFLSQDHAQQPDGEGRQ